MAGAAASNPDRYDGVMVLLTPGPTPVPLPVREAMARPIMHHRTPEFEAIVRCMNAKLEQVFCTKGPVLTIPGSGTTAAEAVLCSLVRARDVVATFSNGKFGERWGAAYRRLGQDVMLSDLQIKSKWGEPLSTDVLGRFLDSTVGKRTALFALVHCETSTATTNDLRAMVEMIRQTNPNALIVADCITSVGAIPMEPDAWGVDAVIGASQKALRNAPGLGFVSLSERAQERLTKAGRLASLSINLNEYLKGYEDGRFPYTAPVANVMAQDAALDMILTEGLETIHKKTSDLANATRAALTAMGLPLASSAPSDSVTAVRMPEGSREGLADEVRAVCKEASQVLLAGGQNEWAGQVLRMSHMGAVTASDTITGVEAIAEALRKLGPIEGADPDAGAAMINERLGAVASESMSSATA